MNSKWLLTVDKNVSNEVCEKGEELIFFDVIDDTGKVTPKSATYIITVSTFHVSVFALDKKGLKRIRHKNASGTPIVEASITAGGILMVRSIDDIKLIALPDVSYDSVAEMSFDFDAAPPLKPKEDFISAPQSIENIELKLPPQPAGESEGTLPISVDQTSSKKKDKKAAKKAKKEKKAEKHKKHHKTDKTENTKDDNNNDKVDADDDADDADVDDEENNGDVEDQPSPQNSPPVDDVGGCDVIENIKAVNPIVLPHRGLIVFERNATTIYLDNISDPLCFDESNLPPALAPPPVTGLKKLFGKKSGVTLEEADRFFLFNRSSEQPNTNSKPDSQNKSDDNKRSSGEVQQSAASACNNLAETQELMQQLLVKANERGEQLNELEIKAKKLLKTARKYRNTIRKFHH